LIAHQTRSAPADSQSGQPGTDVTLSILVFAPQVPWPPTQGAAIRNFHIVRALARKHRVTLLTFGDPDAAPGPLERAGVEVVAVPEPGPRALGSRVVDQMGSLTPDLARRLQSETMFATARLRAILESGLDLVQVEGLEMAPYGLDVLTATPAGARARMVYDAHNVEWLLQQRAYESDRAERRVLGAAYSKAQALLLRRYEARVVRAAALTVAVSEPDSVALAELAPGARIVVAPNAVDSRTFQPGRPDGEDPALLVFTGKMDFRPNVDAVTWFVDEVLHRIQAVRPDVRLAIVGRDPTPAVRALATRPGIVVTGAVDDVRPWIARACVVVAPLRSGGGTRLKILEAFAMGKAVVATPLGLEGIEATPGQDVLVAAEPREFAHVVVGLLGDPARRAALGASARRLVEFRYRWEQVGWELEAVIRREIGRG
jgi:sugar transferase (PEP-CTERM/EpsH1 system associated)